MDKIHTCIDLICDAGYATREPTLKQTYEKLVGIYTLNRDNIDMWHMVWEHKITSLFQMEGQTGIQGIKELKPTSVDDLAILNSTLRLMAQEKGGEMPTAKLARFKANPNEWIKEMQHYGLGAAEQAILNPVLGMSYGLCIAQEQFMELVQLPELGGFSLTWADKLRKSIAKKNPKEYLALTEEFYKVTNEKGINNKFAKYVWDVLIAMSRGYGFNQSHTLAYSLIALQEMNLAFRYPIIFWNCACLINDAGGNELDEIEEDVFNDINNYSNEMEEFTDEDEEEDSYEEDEDCDGFPATVIKTTDGKKKKKTKTTNYGKISSAIGKFISEGIKVTPPNINQSDFTFSPDVDNNSIRYGLSGITRIGEELIKNIILNRPYTSINDFLNKVKVNKTQMINLIKSGAFDEFGDRYKLMEDYILSISDQKQRLTLANIKMLSEHNLIPEEYALQVKIYNFNKYLKKHKYGLLYELDDIAARFYDEHYDYDMTRFIDNKRYIDQCTWDKIYDKEMNIMRKYLASNKVEVLKLLNKALYEEVWDKYCLGSISKWEMDSVSFYSHEHELIHSDDYNFGNFYNMPEEPEVEHFANFKGKKIPIYNIVRIAGTVLDKNKNKNTVTILTTNGVVTVKIYKAQFALYDRQLSKKMPDGKKKVIEKSWFSRGNKVFFTGYRRGNEFVLKKYKNTPYDVVGLITKIDKDGTLHYITERAEV